MILKFRIRLETEIVDL